MQSPRFKNIANTKLTYTMWVPIVNRGVRNVIFILMKDSVLHDLSFIVSGGVLTPYSVCILSCHIVRQTIDHSFCCIYFWTNSYGQAI